MPSHIERNINIGTHPGYIEAGRSLDATCHVGFLQIDLISVTCERGSTWRYEGGICVPGMYETWIPRIYETRLYPMSL